MDYPFCLTDTNLAKCTACNETSAVKVARILTERYVCDNRAGYRPKFLPVCDFENLKHV